MPSLNVNHSEFVDELIIRNTRKLSVGVEVKIS